MQFVLTPIYCIFSTALQLILYLDNSIDVKRFVWMNRWCIHININNGHWTWMKVTFFFHFQIIESFIWFIIFTIQHPVRVRGTLWWLFSGALLVHPSEWAIFSEPMVLDSLIQNFRSVYSMEKLKYKNRRSICYPNSILTKYNFRLYSQNGQKDLPIIYWSISLFIDA